MYSGWLLIVAILAINLIYLSIVSGSAPNDYQQLPNCVEDLAPGLVLVSTIDGKLSAVNSEGLLQWQIDTDPGPLLTSNIHKLELTNSGKWIRIIPSLTGSLYRFDGITIDQIPVSAESLLRSSFKYADDLVMAGGLEVTTYGIGFRTGKIFFTCSALKCTNNSNSENDVEDVLMLERSTQTVRAVETQSGNERWNFSVGYHNIKLPQITCTDPHANLFNWNISAIIPDGLLLASKFQDNAKTSWQYHFSSPIVRVWKWNGHKITEIDLFQIRPEKDPNDTQVSPVIYLGMHKKQLYIHESYNLKNREYFGSAIVETSTLVRIPWKPISASGFLTEEDSTALSVLYSSEYVNGHGYYLYSEADMNKKNTGLCKNNRTISFKDVKQKSGTLLKLCALWWKEIFVTLITVTFLFNLMFKTLNRNHQNREVIFVERPTKIPIHTNILTKREPDNDIFNSRYLNDFDTLRCIGKGGFGVVFEVKQKIDECHYAIKRIVLPNEESRREAVMREVKALAKLEHHNIVRYFNSWVEKPPVGWQQEHDSKWIKETTELLPESTSHNVASNEPLNSNSTVFSNRFTLPYPGNKTETNDSFIVFNKSCSITVSRSNSYEESSKNESISEDDDSIDLQGVECPPTDHSTRSYNIEANCSNHSPVFLYIQMQLCQKHSLKEWLIENKDRRLTHVLDIFRQIVSAVEYVHMQGLIHRDLKPSNIFFSMDGQIKIGDFGLVKDEEESRPEVTSIMGSLQNHTKQAGTRLYMSPEQLKGLKYNYKVDIYSLGLIFFELLVYFSTDMERVKTLTNLRENKFPGDFIEQRQDEYNLLTQMLCHLPEKRLTTMGIRARAPLNCCDSDYNEEYDFELPKFVKLAGQVKT